MNKYTFLSIRLKTIRLVAIATIYLIGCNSDQSYVLKNFDLGAGRKIVIIKPPDCDGGTQIYYKVYLNGIVIVPKTIIGSFSCRDMPYITFKLISQKNGNIVGIYYEPITSSIDGFPNFENGETWTLYTLKKYVWIVHDFDSSRSYPYDMEAFESLFSSLSKNNINCCNDIENLNWLNRFISVGSMNSHVSKIGLKYLDKLPNLQELSFYGSDITNDKLIYISKLKKLKRLSLESTKITDKGLDSLINLTNLVDLNLHCNNISATSIKKLRKKLPNTNVYPDIHSACLH